MIIVPTPMMPMNSGGVDPGPNFGAAVMIVLNVIFAGWFLVDWKFFSPSAIEVLWDLKNNMATLFTFAVSVIDGIALLITLITLVQSFLNRKK